MTARLDPLSTVVVIVVMLCWFIFAAVFVLRKRPPKSKERKRDKSFVTGIILQVVSYSLVWSFQRPRFSAIVEMGFIPELILAILTVMIAVGSVWLVMSAVQKLGKQWALAARVVSDHRLIVEGPYRLVRHPIYSGMFGMMLATGFAISQWIVLVPAAVLFWWGTRIRTRTEESLLREAFGQEYEDYIRKVPSLIPRILGRPLSGD